MNDKTVVVRTLTRQEAAAKFDRYYRYARKRILQVPDAVATEVTADMTEQEVEAIIDRHIRTALADITGRIADA